MRNKTSHKLRTIVIVSLAILAVLVVGFVIYSRLATAGPEQAALDALVTDELVDVEDGDSDWLVFRPAAATPQAGLIFYPGAYVDPRAYAPAARAIAAAGYMVIVPAMPLSLAIFGANEAAAIIEAFPEIDRWAVGGHSLGGAMAAQFLAGNPDVADGLVLWGAYPGQNVDLSQTNVEVVSVYGDNDGVSAIESVDGSRLRLPPGTEWALIEGGNHAQFGWYGPQNGDQPAKIDRLEQQALAVEATLRLLDRISQ